MYRLPNGHSATITRPSSRVITPANTTTGQGVPVFMLKPRTILATPEATRDTPRNSVRSLAVRSGFSKVRMPAAMYSRPSTSQSANLPQDFTWKALITSAAPDTTIMRPTTNTLTAVARATLDKAMAPAAR